jgi:hypothetical protein
MENETGTVKTVGLFTHQKGNMNWCILLGSDEIIKYAIGAMVKVNHPHASGRHQGQTGNG